MRNIIETVFKTVTLILTNLVIRGMLYSNKKSLPKDIVKKVFNKVWDYYSNSTTKSNKSLIRTLLQARRNLLSDINRLTVSAYTLPVWPSAGGVLADKGSVSGTKKLVPAPSPGGHMAEKEALENAFVSNYPALKSFKSIIFGLDSKVDTLRLVQRVLMLNVKFSFWPLLFITIYLYLIKLLTWSAIFLGTGYGYLRYSGVEVQTNDYTRLMLLVRDWFINFWTKFVKKAFDIELVNRDEVYRQAREDAYADLENRLEEIARQYASISSEIPNKVVEGSVTAVQPNTKVFSANDFTIIKSGKSEDLWFCADRWAKGLSNYINSWLPGYDTLITSSIITVSSMAALTALGIYLHKGGTIYGHEDKVVKVYRSVMTYLAWYYFGDENIIFSSEDGKKLSWTVNKDADSFGGSISKASGTEDSNNDNSAGDSTAVVPKDTKSTQASAIQPGSNNTELKGKQVLRAPSRPTGQGEAEVPSGPAPRGSGADNKPSGSTNPTVRQNTNIEGLGSINQSNVLDKLKTGPTAPTSENDSPTIGNKAGVSNNPISFPSGRTADTTTPSEISRMQENAYSSGTNTDSETDTDNSNTDCDTDNSNIYYETDNSGTDN